MTNVLIGAIVMSMACGILALNCASYLALKLALDSNSSGLGLGLGLEGPGLGLGLEGPGHGLVLGLWILALTTTLSTGQIVCTMKNNTLNANSKISSTSKIIMATYRCNNVNLN